VAHSVYALDCFQQRRLMNVGRAIRQGFTQAKRAKTGVWVLFLVNLGLAVLAALPIYQDILEVTRHSRMSQVLAAGLSPDWLTDFNSSHPGAMAAYAHRFMIYGLAAIFLNTLLAGGVLGAFQPGPAQSLSGFIHDCRYYSWRLLRLMAIGLTCYWIVFRLFNQGLGDLADHWTQYWLEDRSVFWVKLIPVILTLAGLLVVNLVVDFARVRLIAEDGSSAVQAFLGATGFALGHLGRALAVYTIPSLCGVALLAAYLLVTPHSEAASTASVAASASGWSEPLRLALLFFFQQAVILGRFWFRVATWGSEWSLYFPQSGHERH
jgi:hypothetical protein